MSRSPASSAMAANLSARLVEEGYVRTQAIADAFANVPRDAFVSRLFVRAQGQADATGWQELSAESGGAAEEWLRRVWADATLVTDLDATGRPTISSTAPWLMATMLEALELDPRHRVLEVGTGTGYNAAVLACLLASPAQLTT